jgi:hypothetical protein
VVAQNFSQYYNTHREEFTQRTLVLLNDEQLRIHVPLDGTLHSAPDGWGTMNSPLVPIIINDLLLKVVITIVKRVLIFFLRIFLSQSDNNNIGTLTAPPTP